MITYQSIFSEIAVIQAVIPPSKKNLAVKFDATFCTAMFSDVHQKAHQRTFCVDHLNNMMKDLKSKNLKSERKQECFMHTILQ